MDKETATELCRRGDKAFSVRLPMLSYWQGVADNFYPQRADFTVDHVFGHDFGAHLFDESPVVMRRDLCNSFSAMLRPRGQRWFKASVLDEKLKDEPGVSDWLDSASTIMWRHMYSPAAGFVRATKESDHDFGTFGNAVISLDTNRAGKGLLYRCHHLRDCAWLENADGQIDTFFREMELTARQINQKWPKADLHRNIKEAVKKEPERTFRIWHVMLPTADYALIDQAGARKVERMRQAFISVYIDKTHGVLINVAGSHEFRYIVPRWQTIQGWPYAVSPATSDTLPAARQLQAMARTGIEALEKSVDPPQKAVAEAIRGEINLFAGGTTWVERDYDERTGASFELLEVGKNAILGLQALDSGRVRMGESMFVSKLNMPQTHAKTAFETQQLVEEHIRAAIPLFEPLEEGYNALILNATFSMLLRLGAFGPLDAMPDALSSAGIEWSFENPLQQATERVKAQTFQVAAGILQMAAPMDKTVMQDFIVREAARDAIRGAGAPESWLRDKADADAMAEEQARLASEQDEAAAALQMIGGAGQAAGAVGDGLAKLGVAPV